MKPIPSSRLRRIAALLVATVATSTAIFMSTSAQADDSLVGFSWFGGGHRVTGSGNLANENRVVTGFQAIALRTSMKLVLRQGTREGIELRADDNVLPLIETTVVDRGGVPTLEITTKKGTSLSTRLPVVATIDLISLRALSISGSGDVTSEALKTPGLALAISGSGQVKLMQLAAEEVSANVSGSGDITLGGRTGRLRVAISGRGNVDTRALEADDVTLNVAGSGDADVTARKTLTVSIAGVGNVKYVGDAAVKSSIAGRGSVSKQ